MFNMILVIYFKALCFSTSVSMFKILLLRHMISFLRGLKMKQKVKRKPLFHLQLMQKVIPTIGYQHRHLIAQNHRTRPVQCLVETQRPSLKLYDIQRVKILNASQNQHTPALIPSHTRINCYAQSCTQNAVKKVRTLVTWTIYDQRVLGVTLHQCIITITTMYGSLVLKTLRQCRP